MSNWKTRLFGRNRFNFYSWVFAGVGVIIGAMVLVAVAAMLYEDGKKDPAQFALLFAIVLLLIGLFGVAVQEYLARYVDATEREE